MSFSPQQVQQAQQHLHNVVMLSPRNADGSHAGISPFAPKPTNRDDAWPGGTPNMRRTGQTLLYVDWNQDAGLLALLEREEREGFEFIEPFPGTHDHLNYGAAGVGLKVAHDRGNKPLVSALVRWFQKGFKLCRLMDAGYKVGPWGPGTRASDGGPLTGSNMGRTLTYVVAQGGKMRPKQAADKGNTGALALSLLPADLRASLLLDPGSFKLCSELRVARRVSHGKVGGLLPESFPMGDYVAWFPNGIAGGLDVALAAGVWDGRPMISRDVNAEVLDKIDLCGPPVIIPGVSQISAG